MKKLILVLLFIVLVAEPVFGALNEFTTSIDTRKTIQNSHRFTALLTIISHWLSPLMRPVTITMQ